MRNGFLASLAAALLFVVHPLHAQAQPATTAPNLSPQQEQAIERMKLEADNAALPRREATSIDQVIRFSRQNGQLIAKAQLEDLQQETRIIVPDMPGFLKMRLFTPAAATDRAETGYSFTQNDVTGPLPSQSITSISLTAGKLAIARDWERGDVSNSVQLLQDPPSPDPNPESPTIVLYISRQDPTGATPNISFKRTAASFDDLCIRFADDVNQYLRPIIRDFKQEAAVFAPDPRVAWQVLGSDYTIDPATLEKVNALVTKLDADSYEDRQTALASLREIGQPAAIILMRAERSAMSPEKQSGVDTFLASFVQLTGDEVRSMRDSTTFLLDVLTMDDVDLRKLAWERVKSITQTNVQFDPSGDEAQRAVALDQLRASLKKS